MEELVLKESVVLEKTTRAKTLTIAPSVQVSAPKGKNLTLTVDGVHKNIAPGVFSGDVVLAVTEGFGREGGFGPPSADRPMEFTAAICAENGQIIPEKSVLSAVQGGTVKNGEISDVRIVSAGDKLGGLDLTDGSYRLNNISIQLDGYGHEHPLPGGKQRRDR